MPPVNLHRPASKKLRWCPLWRPRRRRCWPTWSAPCGWPRRAGAIARPGNAAEDQHLLAALVSGLLHCALAAGGRRLRPAQHGPLRPYRRPQRHCRRRFLRGGGQQPTQARPGQVQPAYRPPGHAPEPWVRYEPRAKMLVLDDIYPEGIEIPQIFAGQEHRAPAHHEDPRLHHHDRRHEERLWRTAAPVSATGPTRSFTRRWSTCWPSSRRYIRASSP